MSIEPLTEMQVPTSERIAALMAAMNARILGKPEQVKLALASVLAGGHLLIEDIPGVGKTTLAQALADCLGLESGRVQCTSDLLPADVTGISVYKKSEDRFEFVPGPIFCELLLADELNRATPKTQSALLEAMQESQVTVDGVSRALPQPFVVVATQNPLEQSGTNPLPESQLDRFLMRLEMGYPDAHAERAIIAGMHSGAASNDYNEPLGAAGVMRLRKAVSDVKISEPMLDYIQALVAYTRVGQSFREGLSTRGAMAIATTSRAIAYIEGRAAVYPDDVQQVVPAVVGHRLRAADRQAKMAPAEIGASMIAAVPIP